jgi:hypothetical protein
LEVSIAVSSEEAEDEEIVDGDLFISSDGNPVPLTEGDLNLGDNRILFSWGDLIICTCDPGDFLRFPVGGFSVFLPVAFRFNNKNFTVATAAMPLEATEFPTS